MKFEIEKNKLDLGVTPIENMFINTHIAKASESQIKVYLYALSLVHSGVEEISNENIANEMNLSEGQVVDAWKHWIEEDVIEETEDGYVFKSMISKLFLSNIGQNNNNYNIKQTKSLQDNIFVQNKDTKAMFDSIEQGLSIGKEKEVKLNQNEIKNILELLNDFNLDPQYVSEAYFMAVTETGNNNVFFITQTLRNWAINGIVNSEKLNQYFEDKKITNSKNSNNYEKKTNKKKIIEDKVSKEERMKRITERMKRPLPTKRKG